MEMDVVATDTAVMALAVHTRGSAGVSALLYPFTAKWSSQPNAICCKMQDIDCNILKPCGRYLLYCPYKTLVCAKHPQKLSGRLCNSAKSVPEHLS